MCREIDDPILSLTPECPEGEAEGEAIVIAETEAEAEAEVPEAALFRGSESGSGKNKINGSGS